MYQKFNFDYTWVVELQMVSIFSFMYYKEHISFYK